MIKVEGGDMRYIEVIYYWDFNFFSIAEVLYQSNMV